MHKCNMQDIFVHMTVRPPQRTDIEKLPYIKFEIKFEIIGIRNVGL